MVSEDGLKQALATLKGVDLDAMDREIANLLAVKEWALSSLRLDYGVGDRVEIVTADAAAKAAQRESGWYPYREALRVGQTGVVREIKFNRFTNRWRVVVAMDRAWSVGEDGVGKPLKRYWHGPEDECPDGFEFYKEEPSVFSFGVHWVARAQGGR